MLSILWSWVIPVSNSSPFIPPRPPPPHHSCLSADLNSLVVLRKTTARDILRPYLGWLLQGFRTRHFLAIGPFHCLEHLCYSSSWGRLLLLLQVSAKGPLKESSPDHVTPSSMPLPHFIGKVPVPPFKLPSACWMNDIKCPFKEPISTIWLCVLRATLSVHGLKHLLVLFRFYFV